MKFQKNEIIVIDIAGENAGLVDSDLTYEKQRQLTILGFVRNEKSVRRPIKDDNDRIYLVQELINLKALFSSGKDWSPTEIVELYLSKGLISGPYKRISWKNQDECTISTETGSGSDWRVPV